MNRDDLTPVQWLLVEHHLHVANHAVLQAALRWPRADRADLWDDALAGLMDAAARYEDRGVTFTGYARQRVRGAIIDGHRARHGRHGHRARVTRPIAFDDVAGDRPLDHLRELGQTDDELEHVEDRIHAAATVHGLALSERNVAMLVELGSGRRSVDVAREFHVDPSRIPQVKALARRYVAEQRRHAEPTVPPRRRCAQCGTVIEGRARVFCSLRCGKLYRRPALVRGRYRARRPSGAPTVVAATRTT